MSMESLLNALQLPRGIIPQITDGSFPEMRRRLRYATTLPNKQISLSGLLRTLI